MPGLTQHFFLFIDAANNVDFTTLSTLAVSIINKLDRCQGGITASDTTVSQFERRIKTARTDALTGNVAPPPRPTTQAPPVEAPRAAVDTRKAAVNFSAKDLAALKHKKAEEEEDRIAYAAASAQASSVPAAPMAPARVAFSPKNSASAAAASAQQDEAEGGDGLPPGWVEKLDKKSGRLYYVNSYVTTATSSTRQQQTIF